MAAHTRILIDTCHVTKDLLCIRMTSRIASPRGWQQSLHKLSKVGFCWLQARRKCCRAYSSSFSPALKQSSEQDWTVDLIRCSEVGFR